MNIIFNTLEHLEHILENYVNSLFTLIYSICLPNFPYISLKKT